MRTVATMVGRTRAVLILLIGSLAVWGPGLVTPPEARAGLAPIGATMSPGIAGNRTIGSPQTVVAGEWTVPGVSVSYQWLRDNAPIPGATGVEYTPTMDDWAVAISVRAVATKPGYAPGTATSEPIFPVPPTVQNLQRPRLGPVVRVGSQVVPTAGTWRPADADVTVARWLRDGQTIVGQQGSGVYVPRPSDVGHRIAIVENGTRTNWISDEVTSASVLVRRGLLRARTAPAMSGSARVGRWLTVSTGRWNTRATRQVQWQHRVPGGRWKPISTGRRVFLARSLEGHRVRPRITVSARGYLRRTVTLPAVLVRP